MGPWRWPNLAAVSFVPIVAFLGSWSANYAPMPFGPYVLPPQQVGDWIVVAAASGSREVPDGIIVTWRVKLCPGCLDASRSLRLSFGDSSGAWGPAVELAGDANSLRADLRLGDEADAGDLHLWLEIRSWRGDRLVAGWPIANGTPIERQQGR